MRSVRLRKRDDTVSHAHPPDGILDRRGQAQPLDRRGDLDVETLEERIRRAAQEEVGIVQHDPKWPDVFACEKAHLLSCLPNDLIRRIEHFGSTAVPGLAAKPIIDILVEVTDLEATRQRIVPVLKEQGYDYFWRPAHGDNGPPYYAWFIKRDRITGVRTHHIHMVTPEFSALWDGLFFRDYLIEHARVAGEYQALKLRLAAVFSNDRAAYTRGKTEFVGAITERAKRQREKA